MSTPRLKYSKRLAAAGAASAAALTMSTASAAIAVTDAGLNLPYGNGWMSFTPTGASWVPTFDNSYMGIIRNCGLNLVSTNSNFQWTSGTISHGTMVDSLLTYGGTPNAFLPYPADGAEVYAGYRLLNQGAGGDETYYGYVQVTGGPGNSFVIDFYSYETSPNTGIVAVPEPSTTLLWVAGAGLAFTRRRRRA